MARLAGLLVAVLLALTGAARASTPAQACTQAALAVSAETGVPADILGALTLTETGRQRDGVVQPWAWSVNAEGSGTWFDDARHALAFAEDRVAQGRPNLDIGCFQINYRWHGEQFPSVAAMFEPMQNARYAARFLSQLYAETGSWRAAAGAFHSRSPAEAQKYLARFDSLRAMLQQRGWGGMTGTAGTYNRFADEGGSVRMADAGGGEFLGVGVEAPVPDMRGSGQPVDLSLDGGGRGDGDPMQGGWDPPTLPGEDALAPAEPRRRRAQGERRMLLGAPLGSAATGSGSLAVLGGGTGPLLQQGRALLDRSRRTVASAEP